MLTKNDKFIKYARERIQHHFSANVIQYIELEKRTSKLRLQRIMLHELADGTYFVSLTTYNCRVEVNSVENSSGLYMTKHKHIALDKINIIVNGLEQEGYDVTDQFEAPLWTIARNGWRFRSPTFKRNIQFHNENHQNYNDFLFQKLPAGLQVVVMIDDQGKASINDLEDTNNILISDLKVNGNARKFLDQLAQQDGFRSLILEAVYDGENLYITDGSYIHDTDLREMPFEKRHKILAKHISDTQNNKVCGLIEALELPPEQWGNTARNGFVKALMARRKNAHCSLYRSDDNSTSATIIGESEPNYFDCVEIKGNTATLRKPNNRNSTYIHYPLQDNKMMLKALHVIGPACTSEKAFMY